MHCGVLSDSHSDGTHSLQFIHSRDTSPNLMKKLSTGDMPFSTACVCDVCRCDEKGCDGLLRPHVIWFGETLDSQILTKVEKELETCDLCLVVSLTLM